MLRIRIGRRWTRERGAAPHDSVSLELDGVALVDGAEDEPLLPLVESLLGCTGALARGTPMADISLPESGLVLCLENTEDGCALRIASLARPARLVRRVRLDWGEWSDAVVRMGEHFAVDLEGSAVPAASRRAVRDRLRALRQPPRHPPARPVAPLGLRLGAAGKALALRLNDGSGLLERAPRGHAAALGALLGSGRIWISGAPDGWHLDGPALLHVLELVRCGEEVQRALGTGLDTIELQLPDGPSRVSLGGPGWSLGKETLPWTAEEVARALLSLGASAARAVRWAVPTQRRNPHLEELVTRSEAALALLRPLTGERRERTPVRRRKAVRAARAVRPLRREGSLRRLRFLPVACAPGLAGPGPAALVSTETSVVLLSDRGMDVLGWDGKLRIHRPTPRGGAAAPDGRALGATRERLYGFGPDDANPRWFQPHDGAALDPVAISAEQLLLFGVERRGVRAVDALTGRERWSFLPARTRRLHLALSGVTVLAASESGVLTGLDAHDGTVRFRVAAPLPFTGPAIPWGPVVLAPLGREDRSALLALDPVLGEVRWLTELPLRQATPPTAGGARAWIAGLHEDRPTLACLDVRGRLLWQRAVPTPERPAGVLHAGVELVVVGTTGAAVRVRRDGKPEWRSGGAGGEATAVPPALEHGVVLAVGPAVRALDVRHGRVLAELPAGRGIRAMAVSPRLDVALLDESGDLAIHRLASHFAVV
ncbi:MAG TPA: PQQ-binding-like beta-propeller repeat protein [Myxococcaceae bacterium]|nr:PQQ-binding-like beta-propeller repeat protein [Myxococcaceae bacterium]